MEDTNGRTKAREVHRADDGWTKSELEKVDLGDCRLGRRLRCVAEDLSRQPEYPINVASNDAASPKAAYRLFDNERVTADKIIGFHAMRGCWARRTPKALFDLNNLISQLNKST